MALSSRYPPLSSAWIASMVLPCSFSTESSSFPVPLDSCWDSRDRFFQLDVGRDTLSVLCFLGISVGHGILVLDDVLGGDFTGDFFVLGFSDLELIHLVGVVPPQCESGFFLGWIKGWEQGKPSIFLPVVGGKS